MRRVLTGATILICPTVPRSFELKELTNFTPAAYSGIRKSGANVHFFNLLHYTGQTLQRQYSRNVADEVIDPGLWLTTAIFLSVSAAFSLFSAIMALVNIAFNPIEPVLR